MTTSPWPTRRSSTSIQLLIQLGLDMGLSLDTCLYDTGITAAQMVTPQGEIDASRELQLIDNLLRALPQRTDLGLLAGRRYRLSTYGVWGYALISSATARQAAELGLRYVGLTYAFNRISLVEDGDQACLQFDDNGIPDHLQPFIVQRDMLGALVVIRELLGDHLPLAHLQLRQTTPVETATIRDAFACEPEFVARHNRLIFPAQLLDAPLPLANPALVQACEQQCRAILARHQWHEGLAGQVRQLLLQAPGQIADMERIAEHLHMSSRTLHRRLNLEGSSFRALQDEVRQALAEELLETGGISLEEIAARLGYGEASNFIHAFKRWKGVTPGRYQRSRAI